MLQRNTQALYETVQDRSHYIRLIRFGRRLTLNFDFVFSKDASVRETIDMLQVLDSMAVQQFLRINDSKRAARQMVSAVIDMNKSLPFKATTYTYY